MAWKDLAERLQNDVKKQQDEIARLQYQLAEAQEKNATAHPGHGHPAGGQVQQVANLQHQIETIRAERDSLAKENASLNETLQKTLGKLDQVEPETSVEIKKLNQKIETLNKEKKDLEYTIRGQNEKLLKVQAIRSSDQAPSAREKGLQESISDVRDKLRTANAEVARLKRTNESLARQLDAEKRENTGRIGFMKSDASKGYDQDDDEPPPIGKPELKREVLQGLEGAMNSPKKMFKRPYIPEELKATPAAPKKLTKGAAPKKRKRTEKDDLDEDMADLEIGNFKAPVEPRRKRQNTFQGSYGSPVELDGANDEEVNGDDLPTNPLFQNKKNAKAPAQITTKSTANSNNFTKNTVPPTPVSPTPTSPPFALPDLAFAFKAICTYHIDGQTPHNVYWPEDLKAMTELHDRVKVTTNLWESCAGEDWKWEYESRIRHAKTPACVTRKLQKQRSNWRKGCEGTHACKDCAKSGRPCFTYALLEKDGEHEYGEFRLLPLCEEDREKAVVKHKEIRYWVNDEIKLVDADDEGEDMEWE